MRGTTLDTFQEMDQVPMMKPIVKGAYRVDLGYRIPDTSASRFGRRSTARAVPIYLDLPGRCAVRQSRGREDSLGREELAHRCASGRRSRASRKAIELLRRHASPSCSPAVACCGQTRRTNCGSSSRRPAFRFTPHRKAAASSPRTIRARSRARVRPHFARRTSCWSSERGRTRCSRSCARRAFHRRRSSST